MVEWELPKLHTAVRFRSPALLVVLLWTVAGCAPYLTAAGGGPSGAIPPSAPGVYHRVERGETVWRIAKAYGVELEALAAANRLADARRIEVGQQIFIPGATKVAAVPPPASALPAAGVARVPMDGGEDFIWPVRGRVIAYYGAGTSHGPNKGIDIQALAGTQVRAARSGRVVFLEENLRGFGKTVIVEHGDELTTVYTHLASLAITANQAVRQGDIIGLVGSTGRANAPFLHFEVRRRRRPENPYYFLS